MRLDLFLKISRLCPRRTIAQKLCDAGFVFLNGRPAKSGHTVKPGDTITMRRPDRETELRIITVPNSRSVSKEESRHLVEVLRAEKFERLDL